LLYQLKNAWQKLPYVLYAKDALARYGRPYIFYADQGSYFTSFALTKVLQDAGIRISMDGKDAGWIM